MRDYLPPTYSINFEDSSLIAARYREKLEILEVGNSKVRNAIPVILFNKKYHLTIYKIDLAKDGSLQNIFHLSNKSADVSTGYSYGTIGKNIIYRFRYKAGKTKPASEIYLTLAGASIQEIAKDDTIISYHLQCDNISIRYGENEPVDILLIGEEKSFGRTSVFPMDILFLKRKYSVYMLIMTPNDRNASIPVDLLYNVVIGK